MFDKCLPDCVHVYQLNYRIGASLDSTYTERTIERTSLVSQ